MEFTSLVSRLKGFVEESTEGKAGPRKTPLPIRMRTLTV